MIEKRNIALAIVLTIVTCGIYGLYWFVKLTDEANTAANDIGATSGVAALVYTIITCGIYEFFWYYKIGEKLDIASANRGLPTQSRGLMYLLLGIFGLGIISYALMQDSLNNLA